MLDVVVQLVESAVPFDISLVEEEAAEVAAVEVDDDLVWVADLEMEVPRLLELWLSVEVLVVEQEELLPFAPLVEVPRDFFVGGSSREPPFIEFRLPWDGLLLFSFLKRLLDDDVLVVDGDWLEGVGELFTGALRRRPIIVVLAILASFACLRLANGLLFFAVILQPAHRH